MTTGAAAELVRVSDAGGGVRLLVLHRPERRNALDLPLARALHAALVAADDDPGVAAVVLTGTDPAFCAGIDLHAAAAGGEGFFAAFQEHDCIRAAAELRTPLIGAVNGPAMTGGLELALACDLLVASDRAAFADTHVRVGVLPGGGLTVRLPQAVGLRRAKEMSLTGRVVDAAEAERTGLVNRVVPHDRLLAEALEVARAAAAVGRDEARALLAVYDGVAARVGADALAFEHASATSHGVDGAEIGRRRAGVQDGNRRQLEGR